jgi:hypothetical protein
MNTNSVLFANYGHLAVTFFGIAAEFCFLDIRENGWFFLF